MRENLISSNGYCYLQPLITAKLIKYLSRYFLPSGKDMGVRKERDGWQ